MKGAFEVLKGHRFPDHQLSHKCHMAKHHQWYFQCHISTVVYTSIFVLLSFYIITFLTSVRINLKITYCIPLLWSTCSLVILNSHKVPEISDTKAP